jgi:hypothetical protein
MGSANTSKPLRSNAFAEMGMDRDTAAAVYLLDRIHSLGSPRCPSVTCNGRLSDSSPERDLLPALNRLVEHGYLIPMPPRKRGLLNTTTNRWTRRW